MTTLKLTQKKSTRSRRNQKINVLNQYSPDGGSFDLMPSLRVAQHQEIYTFSLCVPAWKRFAMSVGVSEIMSYDNFKLSDINNYQQFTDIFDMYRIRSVQVLFKVVGTQMYWGNSSGDIPQVSTAFDYNDGSSSGAHPKGYQTCLTTVATTSFNRRFSPRTAQQVYYNATSSGYKAGKVTDWLDTSYPAIPHFQLVTNITPTSIDNQFVYEVDVIYTVDFKQVRFYTSAYRVESPIEENDQAIVYPKVGPVKTVYSGGKHKPPAKPGSIPSPVSICDDGRQLSVPSGKKEFPSPRSNHLDRPS